MAGGAWREVRIAWRALAGTPLSTFLAIVAIALGVGGGTTALSVADAAALHPLPYDDPSQLVSVWLQAADSDQRVGLTGADLGAFRAEPGLFGALSGWRSRTVVLAGPDVSEIVDAAAITEGMFSRVLRVQPLLGRDFLPEEDVPGHPPPVLLSHAFWMDRFASSPEALGRSLVLDGEPHIVVGVMPEGFRPPFASEARLWIPARLGVERCQACPRVTALARLAPWTTAAVARDRAALVGTRLAEESPATNGTLQARVLEFDRDRPLVPEGPLRATLLAGSVLLLVACVNVALLLTARGLRRSWEMGVRTAVGATRVSIVRLHIVEGLVLVAIGGLVGVGVTTWFVELLVRLAPDAHPGLEQIRPEGRVLVTMAALAASAAVGFGSAAAFLTRPARVDTVGRRRGAWLGPRWTARLRTATSAVLAVQVGLAMMLAVGAGASLEALGAAAVAEIGVEPEELLAIDVFLPTARFSDPVRRSRVIRSIEDRLERLPGVIAVGSVEALPTRDPGEDVAVVLPDRPIPSGEEAPRVRVQRVSESFFYVAGRRIADGRAFEARDERGRSLVAVVNEAAAERLFAEGSINPVGAKIALHSLESSTPRTVIGVVRDTGIGREAMASGAVVYLPMPQAPVRRATLLVRVADEGEAASSLSDEVRAAVAAVEAGAAVGRTGPLQERIDDAFARERLVATVLGVLATATLILAGLGLFALLASEVVHDAVDLAVRRAVGADDDDLRRSVVWHALFPATSGTALGAAGAWFLFRSTGDSIVGGTGVVSHGVYLIAAALVLTVAVIAAVGPGRRVARQDAVSLLHTE